MDNNYAATLWENGYKKPGLLGDTAAIGREGLLVSYLLAALSHWFFIFTQLMKASEDISWAFPTVSLLPFKNARCH